MRVLPCFYLRQLVYLAGPHSALSAFHHATFGSHLAQKEEIHLPCGLFQPSYGPSVIRFSRYMQPSVWKGRHLNSRTKVWLKDLLASFSANQKSFC